VYLPGAGWGFDPPSEMRRVISPGSCRPESVPPVSGSYFGPPGATMDVGVWVTEL
jgi:hypothetical protein